MINKLFSRVAALCLGLCSSSALAVDYVLTQESTHVVPITRGSTNTTHFGWDSFGAISTPIDDTTPDIGATPPAGVRFRTTTEEDHSSGSGNFYSYGSPPAEEVTVVTSGTVGVAGKTTIVVQMVTLFGGFPSNYILGDINGVSPTVVQGTNAAGRGQLWAVWQLEGNAESYTFTITGAPDTSAYSFDKIEVDTFWSEEGATIGDTMVLAEPTPVAAILEQTSGILAPSSRGTSGTTYFGWDTFGVTGPATIINDNTPDIGSDSTGLARFETRNEQIHQFSGGGNLYLLSFDPEVDLTLDERITVPTHGVVGEEGYTTIILQIASASSGMGGSDFANEIYLSPINDIEPTIVVQGPSASTAQLWAKWEIPGNQATYTIDIKGVPNQQHYSFDKVVVDTKYSRYGYVGDTMKAKTVEITTEVLADAVKGTSYSVQLEATGGNTPHTWSLAEESTLPEGLSLSAEGVISGTPSDLGSFTFTVLAKDGDDYEAEATYALDVVSGITIVTNSLPTAVVGKAYAFTLEAEDGLPDYTWAVTGTLPAGLELDAEEGTITGIPTEAGEATLTFTVTDAEESTTSKELTLVVSPTVLKPVVDAIAFASATPGADFSHTVTATNYPDKFIITGLPKGLKYVTTTGVISGKASVAGVYLVQVRASNRAGTSAQVTAPLIVKALAPSIVGNFTGWIRRDPAANTNLGSTFSLTTTSTGAYTLVVKSAASSKSVKGFLNGSAPQVSVDVGGSLLSLTLDDETQLVSGTHGSASIQGWRTVWDKKFNPASSREGYYSMALDLADEDDLEDVSIPHGVSFATFTVASAGTLKIVGKTADGQAITSASPLGPNGEIALYAALYAKKGSLLGRLDITEDAEGLFIGNTVDGDLTWSKPETKGRTYPAAFDEVELSVEGGYLGFSAKGPVALGLPETGEIDLVFADGGVEESDTDPNVTGAVWTEAYAVNFTGVSNPGSVSVKVNKASGAITGSFTLQDAEPALVRKGVKFEGQIIRLSDGQIKAAGWFLLPQIPGDEETAKTSPILSGAFSIEQTLAP